MAAKRTRTEFTVEGAGTFPYDMLRYDQCWPKYEDETRRLTDTPHSIDLRTVTLISESPNAPTHGRWESFGWSVKIEESFGRSVG